MATALSCFGVGFGFTSRAVVSSHGPDSAGQRTSTAARVLGVAMGGRSRGGRQQPGTGNSGAWRACSCPRCMGDGGTATSPRPPQLKTPVRHAPSAANCCAAIGAVRGPAPAAAPAPVRQHEGGLARQNQGQHGRLAGHCSAEVQYCVRDYLYRRSTCTHCNPPCSMRPPCDTASVPSRPHVLYLRRRPRSDAPQSCHPLLPVAPARRTRDERRRRRPLASLALRPACLSASRGARPRLLPRPTARTMIPTDCAASTASAAPRHRHV